MNYIFGQNNFKIRSIALPITIMVIISILSILLFYRSKIDENKDSKRLLIIDGTIVDPKIKKTFRGSILIKDGVIEKIFHSIPNYKSDKSLKVIDAKGKFLIPGLIDCHIHAVGNKGPGNFADSLSIENCCRLMLFCGVTGCIDLFNDEEKIFKVRDKIRNSNQITSSEIFCAGPAFTCTNGHGTQLGISNRIVNSIEDVDKEFNSLIKRKPDVIKIIYDHYATWMPTIHKEVLRHLIKLCDKNNFKTIVHIGTWQDVIDAINAGATAVTHLPITPVSQEAIQLLQRKNVYMIPAFCVVNDLNNFIKDTLQKNDDLLRKVVSKELLDKYCYKKLDNFSSLMLDWQGLNSKILAKNLLILNQNHVKILTGTDAGNLGVFQGFSLHREMELMVRAGISPWDALNSATILPGIFLKKKYGIEQGDEANILILTDSPIIDIKNSRKIEVVIFKGRVVDRPGLLQLVYKKDMD